MLRFGLVDPSMNVCHKGRKMDALFAMYLKVISVLAKFLQFVRIIVHYMRATVEEEVH